jgi:hypothetical protein
MRAVARALAGVAVVTTFVLAAFPTPGTAGEGADNPLAPFERVIGGKWHMEGSYQTFEWAVGKQGVVAKSYFATDEGEKLVGQGMWFWHPGEKAIKGYFVAVGMGIDVFEYTTGFESDRMVSQLTTYGSGNTQEWEETFDFNGDDEYVWTLFSKTPEGPQKAMGGTYKRQPAGE